MTIYRHLVDCCGQTSRFAGNNEMFCHIHYMMGTRKNELEFKFFVFVSIIFFFQLERAIY